MGVELFVMPLSRYVAGDYITPTMRTVWRDFGHPYIVTRPNKPPLVIPEGVPYGGPGAPAKRRRALAAMPQALASWRGELGDFTLDEESEAEPRCWRPAPASWRELIEVTGPRSHLRLGTVYLPCDFAEPVLSGRFVLASRPAASRELAAIRGRATRDAADELGAALRAAAELSLPMIVDY
jgi:hypothetical protein